jgi:hypothetical protein
MGFQDINDLSGESASEELANQDSLNAEINNEGAEEEIETEEKTGEETQTEEDITQPKTDENHPTKLGRKLKEAVDTIEALKLEIEALKGSRMADKVDVSSKYDEDLFERMCEIEPPPVDMVTTPREKFLVDQWERKTMGLLRQRSNASFAQDYFAKINSMKEIGGDLHAKISHMITDPADKGEKFNVKRRGHTGGQDAEINYLLALKTLLAEKGTVKDAGTFQHQKADGSGVTASTKSSGTQIKSVKLDPLVAEYAKFLGLSDKEVAETMNRPITETKGVV